MQRSSSLVNLANGSKLSELPMWDPLSDTAKKEIARDRLAASLVHLVPVVIIVCAVLLWFFSYPEIRAAESGRRAMTSNVTAFRH